MNVCGACRVFMKNIAGWRFLTVVSFAFAVMATERPSLAQRAMQSPVMVTVARTKSAGSSQQIGLKITIRNMSKKDVDIRLEALFLAEGGSRGNQEGIYCERKTSAALKAGESRDFTTESDSPHGNSYSYNGSYYYYSSMKQRGYLTRVFADGQLVNVTGSAPSYQKAGWDPKAMAQLGYTGEDDQATSRPVPASPRVIAREEPPPVEPLSRPAPSNAVSPAPLPLKPVSFEPAKPLAPTWDEKIYVRNAKLYNAAVESYQLYLKNRGDGSVLKKAESDLRTCVDEFTRIQYGAPASYDLPGLITRCNQTIFAIQGTMQVPR